MSNLKVGIGLTLDGATGNICGGVGIVTATGVSVSQINDGQIGGNRNIIINGAMQVAQRGTSSTSSGIYSVDRMLVQFVGHDEAMTQAQHALTSSDTGPWAKGFRSSLHITNGNQTGGAGAGDYSRVVYNIEAQDIANSGWDYSSTTSYLTLSYWVRSSVAQNFDGYIRTPDGTVQGYSFQTGTLSANTWTKITKTIPGNSNLTFDNDNGTGFAISFSLFMGTDFTDAGNTLNTWAAYASGNRMPNNTSTWYTTNDATFEMTGLQLEVGSVASEFEHRSYGEELARCQRYYEVLYMSSGTACCYSTGDSTYKYAHTWYFSAEKRAQASVALVGNSSFYVSGGSTITLTGIFTSKDHCMFYYDSGMFRLGDGSQDASVEASSEL